MKSRETMSASETRCPEHYSVQQGALLTSPACCLSFWDTDDNDPELNRGGRGLHDQCGWPERRVTFFVSDSDAHHLQKLSLEPGRTGSKLLRPLGQKSLEVAFHRRWTGCFSSAEKRHFSWREKSSFAC